MKGNIFLNEHSFCNVVIVQLMYYVADSNSHLIFDSRYRGLCCAFLKMLFYGLMNKFLQILDFLNIILKSL